MEPINNSFNRFPGKVAIVCRYLPEYRYGFYDALARVCSGGVTIFHGNPLRGGTLKTGNGPQIAKSYLLTTKKWMGGSSCFYTLSGLSRAIEDFEPDVIIAEANPRLLTVRKVVALARKHRLPVYGHGLGTQQQGSSLRYARKFIQKRFLALFDGFICYSSRAEQEYLQLKPRSPTVVAHNACRPRPTAFPIRSWVFSTRLPSIAFVGALTARKKVDLLISACEQIAPRPHINIVGEGPELKRLQLLAQKLNVQVSFHGRKQGRELDAILQQCHLFVLPGTGGLAINEALANGLPLIVGEADGTQIDTVTENNGVHLSDANTITLRDAIVSLLGKPAQLEKMARESFKLAWEKINVEAMADEIGRFLVSENRLRQHLKTPTSGGVH